ncbi:MAG: hypothetical protein HFH08_04010 [Bacilli bacterium]|nr:hypothetical protein [Bacilli bacterium]
MEEKEIWKLVQNWIALEKHREEKSFLEHIASLNEQNERLKFYDLELYYKEEESRRETYFFIIRPHLIQMFKGFVSENDGRIYAEDWEMVKQISCDFIKMPEIIGRTSDIIEPFEAIASLLKGGAYIIDGISSEGVNYYQEKNIDGIYGKILESSHYMKIGRRRKKEKTNIKVQKICISELDNIEEVKLIQFREEILPIFPKHHVGQYLIAIDLINSLLKKQVEKVYQLL